MPAHDPHQFATGLSARLATRSRHINVFLGAGSSRACGLPDIAALLDLVVSELPDEQRDQLTRVVAGGNLETALSRLRRIAALVGPNDVIDGLSGHQASALDLAICERIVAILSNPDNTDLSSVSAFATWLIRANYSRPVEVFTVNYDLLVENALDRLGAPYFDGFGGLLRGRFRSDLVDAESSDELYIPSFFTRVWKLHGSLNWSLEDGAVIRRGEAVGLSAAAAIYPSDTKYDESRRVPFVVLQDRFRRALNEPESLTLISGYSWGDAHLNEQIFDAAERRPRSEVIAFCFAQIPDELASRATAIPNLQVVSPDEAIIGAVRAKWISRESELPDFIWENDRFRLGDFSGLAKFLARGSGHSVETSES